MKLISTLDQRSFTIVVTDKFALDEKTVLTVITVDGEIKNQSIYIGGKNYHYFKNIDEFRAKCRTTPYHFYDKTKDHTYWWNEYIEENPKEYIEKNGFNPESLIFIETSSHNFRDNNFKHLAIACRLDEIGGFIQKGKDYHKDWDWESLKEHLKNHPNITDLEENLVPYYNANFHGQKCLHLTVTIESEWREEVESWGKNQIIFGDKDPLNIKQFVKSPFLGV